MEVNYFPFKKPEFKEKIKFPNYEIDVEKIELPNFEINEKPTFLKKEFQGKVDIDKLLNQKGQKYSLPELKQIAKEFKIPTTQKKKDLINAIKIKLELT
jgi:hypothetical protein